MKFSCFLAALAGVSADIANIAHFPSDGTCSGFPRYVDDFYVGKCAPIPSFSSGPDNVTYQIDYPANYLKICARQ